MHAPTGLGPQRGGGARTCAAVRWAEPAGIGGRRSRLTGVVISAAKQRAEMGKVSDGFRSLFVRRCREWEDVGDALPYSTRTCSCCGSLQERSGVPDGLKQKGL
jgi:hypothetical protein